MGLHRITLYVHDDTTHGRGIEGDPVHTVWTVYDDQLQPLGKFDPYVAAEDKAASVIGAAVARKAQSDG